MKTKAAVLTGLGKPLQIRNLTIPALKKGQVLVEVAYSGVCHTQLLESRGHRGADPYLPHCLGHEGSGVVVDIGRAVTRVAPGCRVILSWMKGEGMDVPGSVYSKGTRSAVHAGAVTTFMRLAVVSENRLTPFSEELDLKTAALVGCALPTGLGAVFNTVQARPGQSIAIFGVGGVGLSAVAGAVTSGCHPIVAVDVATNKLKAARQLGAHHQINAGRKDPVAAIKSFVPGGLDVAIECSGRPQVMLQAIQSLRCRGGRAVIVGNAHHGETLELDPHLFNQGKSVLGSWGGDCYPPVDFVKYCRMIVAKQLNVRPLISEIYTLDEINQALDDLESGKVIRPLIRCQG
jgi:S-(hydroxymethyl)glutathione dehydrogenase/alcohol dehydrogenase